MALNSGSEPVFSRNTIGIGRAANAAAWAFIAGAATMTAGIVCCTCAAIACGPASAFSVQAIRFLFINTTLTIPNSFANVFKYGNGLFILPLLAGASQFLMTKIMNGKQTKEQKELQQAQQGQDQTNPMNSPVMKWFFPIFSVWICATSNAAFSIYWMAANVIQIVQQLAVNWYFERQDAKAAELAAAQDIDD